MKKIFLTLSVVLFNYGAIAEPTSVAVSITNIRSYSTGDAYVTFTPNFCSTDTVKLEAGITGNKPMYALLLTAISLSQKVYLEAKNTTGCVGWGTTLESVFMATQ